MSRVALLTLLATCCCVSSAWSQGPNWYDVIIPENEHGFGTVARGSKVRHAFRIVNTTNFDVHIGGYKAKCGCTDVKIGSKDIPPGTQTSVEVTLDTAKFENYKASGITLVFDRPEYREVDLTVTSFIRGDVLIQPGSVDFGVVPRGSERAQTLVLSYHGTKLDWAITKLNTISEHVTADLREIGRSAAGAIQYQLSTRVEATAPAGYLRDEITLTTNDQASPTIPVSVTASVQAAVSVAPSVLNLGRLKPGQVVEKVIVVRSDRPFRITDESGEPTSRARLTIPADSRPLHTLKVQLTAPPEPGPFHTTLTIATDLAGEPPVNVAMFAQIAP